jgi:hypothetical protein
VVTPRRKAVTGQLSVVSRQWPVASSQWPVVPPRRVRLKDEARRNAVDFSFFKEAVHCSTLEPPHPLPLAPKGERGGLISICSPRPLGGEGGAKRWVRGSPRNELARSFLNTPYVNSIGARGWDMAQFEF